jgi:hypothetical protein
MQDETKTVTLEFVGYPLNCWRLVEWSEKNGVKRIVDVAECAEYATLRAMAKNRGFVFPTKLWITRALAGWVSTASDVSEMLNFAGKEANATLMAMPHATGLDGGGIFATREDNGSEWRYDKSTGWMPK